MDVDKLDEILCELKQIESLRGLDRDIISEGGRSDFLMLPKMATENQRNELLKQVRKVCKFYSAQPAERELQYTEHIKKPLLRVLQFLAQQVPQLGNIFECLLEAATEIEHSAPPFESFRGTNGERRPMTSSQSSTSVIDFAIKDMFKVYGFGDLENLVSKLKQNNGIMQNWTRSHLAVEGRCMLHMLKLAGHFYDLKAMSKFVKKIDKFLSYVSDDKPEKPLFALKQVYALRLAILRILQLRGEILRKVMPSTAALVQDFFMEQKDLQHKRSTILVGSIFDTVRDSENHEWIDELLSDIRSAKLVFSAAAARLKSRNSIRDPAELWQLLKSLKEDWLSPCRHWPEADVFFTAQRKSRPSVRISLPYNFENDVQQIIPYPFGTDVVEKIKAYAVSKDKLLAITETSPFSARRKSSSFSNIQSLLVSARNRSSSIAANSSAIEKAAAATISSGSRRQSSSNGGGRRKSSSNGSRSATRRVTILTEHDEAIMFRRNSVASSRFSISSRLPGKSITSPALCEQFLSVNAAFLSEHVTEVVCAPPETNLAELVSKQELVEKYDVVRRLLIENLEREQPMTFGHMLTLSAKYEQFWNTKQSMMNVQLNVNSSDDEESTVRIVLPEGQPLDWSKQRISAGERVFFKTQNIPIDLDDVSGKIRYQLDAVKTRLELSNDIRRYIGATETVYSTVFENCIRGSVYTCIENIIELLLRPVDKFRESIEKHFLPATNETKTVLEPLAMNVRKALAENTNCFIIGWKILVESIISKVAPNLEQKLLPWNKNPDTVELNEFVDLNRKKTRQDTTKLVLEIKRFRDQMKQEIQNSLLTDGLLGGLDGKLEDIRLKVEKEMHDGKVPKVSGRLKKCLTSFIKTMEQGLRYFSWNCDHFSNDLIGEFVLLKELLVDDRNYVITLLLRKEELRQTWNSNDWPGLQQRILDRLLVDEDGCHQQHCHLRFLAHEYLLVRFSRMLQSISDFPVIDALFCGSQITNYALQLCGHYFSKEYEVMTSSWTHSGNGNIPPTAAASGTDSERNREYLEATRTHASLLAKQLSHVSMNIHFLLCEAQKEIESKFYY